MTTPAVVAQLATRRPGSTAAAVEHARTPVEASGARRARRRGEYRSFLTFEHTPDALTLVLGQAATWLRNKGFDVPLEEPGIHVADGRTLTVVHRDSSQCHDVRLLLSEPNTNRGRWDTEVTIHLPEREDGWLSAHVANDRGSTAAPPRLVRWVLDVIEAHDGPLRLTSAVTTVPTPDIDDLLEAVCGEDRHGLLFVVGTADSDGTTGQTYAQTLQRANRWARDVVGLGQVVVLDPLATAEFNAGIGTTHGVQPWTIRTYAPGPDPAWAADARKHRIFSAARLRSTSDAEVGRILGFSARAHAADRRLPASVAATDRDLRRATERLILDSIFRTTAATETPGREPVGTQPVESAATVDRAAAPAQVTLEVEVVGGRGVEVAATVEPEADDRARLEQHVDAAATPDAADSRSQLFDDLQAQLELVRQSLGLDDISAEALAEFRARVDEAVAVAAVKAAHAAEMTEMAHLARARLEDQQMKVEELEEDLQFHRDYAAAADELRDEADLRARRAADEVRYLRKQLAEANHYEAAYGAVPAEAYSSYPESFEDLLARMQAELAPCGVVFTGDAGTTRGLDSQDTSGRLVRSTWECLTALAGYIEAKRDGACETSVHGYLTDAPAGYPVVSRNKFAPKESTSTMNRFAEERRLQVPSAVNPDGFATMEAHFKLGTLGLVSPRMHFYDDTAGTGNVYVGYIGPHLRTEATN